MEQNKQQQDGKSGIGVQPDAETADASAGGEDPRDPSGTASTTDRQQPSALGGDVATRSGTAEGSDSREQERGD